MSNVDEEEERLVRAMDRKANAAFEQKRRDALANYHGKAAGFQLSQDDSAANKEAIKRQVAAYKAADPGPVSPKPSQQSYSSSSPAAASSTEPAPGLELAKYQERGAAYDREFRERQEGADRDKQAELSKFGSSLSAYEESARKRDEEQKRRREEEEQRRREEIASIEAKSRALRERQEQEEREFRRKQEEAARGKAEQLDAMRRADEARRAQLVRTSSQNAAAAPVSPKAVPTCSSCNKELVPQGTVNVKGRPYCYPCSVAVQADKCEGCSKPILTGVMVKAMNRKFHPECLKCARCSGSLDAGYRPRDKKFYCIPCSNKP